MVHSGTKDKYCKFVPPRRATAGDDPTDGSNGSNAVLFHPFGRRAKRRSAMGPNTDGISSEVTLLFVSFSSSSGP